MAVRRKGKAAEKPKRKGAGWLAVTLAWAMPMSPALLINIEAAKGKPLPWVIAAIVFVILGAVCIEGGVLMVKRTKIGALLVLALGLVFVGANLQNALGNAAHFSGSQSDHRKGEQNTARLRQEQLEKLNARRKEQATIAGEKSPAAIEGEIEAAKASDSKRWQATNECNAGRITAPESRTFCANVASLKAKLAAAKERDDIDAKLVPLTTKLEDAGTPPASVDPYADSVAMTASAVGITISLHAKESLTPIKDAWVAIALELAAAFGPMVILAVMRLTHGARAEPKGEEPAATKPAPEDRQKAPAIIPAAAMIVRKPAAQVSDAIIVAPNEAENSASIIAPDHMVAFKAAKTEDRPGEHMSAGEMWALWCEWCEAKGIDPGKQKAFGMRAKTLIQYENKNNRPRYLNVRKREHAALRLAVRNS